MGYTPYYGGAVRFAKDFYIFSEGLRNFPTSKIPVRRNAAGQGFDGKGYSFPMLAIQFLLLRKLHPVIDVFPARIG